MPKTQEWTCPNCNTKAVFSLPQEPRPKAPRPLQTFRMAWREFWKRSPVLTAGILLASGLSITAGVFLYLQGQALWVEAQNQLKTPPSSSPTTVSSSQEIIATTDRVTKAAIAPPAAVTPPPPVTPLRVRAKDDYANFRSGPGMEYPIIGVTRGEKSYAVIDWKERWLKVVLESATTSAPADTAWVRSDTIIPDSNPQTR